MEKTGVYHLVVLLIIVPGLLVAAQMFLAAKGSVEEKPANVVTQAPTTPSVPVFRMPTRSGLIPPPPPF